MRLGSLMKNAIVYCSRTANTKEAAEILEKKLEKNDINVDLIKKRAEKRPGFFKANRTAIKQNEISIKNSDYVLSEYTTLLIGVPSWASHPALLYKSFLKEVDNIKDKRFAVFITGGKSIQSNESAIEVMKIELRNLGVNNIEAKLILR